MNAQYKSTEAILEKLGIEQLNDMQLALGESYKTEDEIIVLSPTGTGKTLAFLLPIIMDLNPESQAIQSLILVPSRELAIQIVQVIREMGSGFRALAVYGGRSGSKDRMELQQTPSILVGTPGRVADHLRHEVIDLREVKTLVLDEFDKSLEVGFENEMREICYALESTQKRILTSATQRIEVPVFVNLRKPVELNFNAKKSTALKLVKVEAKTDNKLEDLVALLGDLGNAQGIIFCNFKDTINELSAYLELNNFRHANFYGGLEQIDRERALIKFRNGSHQILIATDLAARGIDVPELDYIIHFETPPRLEEFTHRNGRTARMHSEGTAYILQGPKQRLPEYMGQIDSYPIKGLGNRVKPVNETLYITGGRKDKISKGDIAGLLIKQGGLSKEELGLIELKTDCAFVAVSAEKAKLVVEKTNNSRLKKKKVRISILR